MTLARGPAKAGHYISPYVVSGFSRTRMTLRPYVVSGFSRTRMTLRPYVVSGFSRTRLTMPYRILACVMALILIRVVSRVEGPALLAQPGTPSFVDATEQAGIAFRHVNGASAEKHIA